MRIPNVHRNSSTLRETAKNNPRAIDTILYLFFDQARDYKYKNCENESKRGKDNILLSVVSSSPLKSSLARVVKDLMSYQDVQRMPILIVTGLTELFCGLV